VNEMKEDIQRNSLFIPKYMEKEDLWEDARTNRRGTNMRDKSMKEIMQ
jgi:hypothetical protein